MQFMKKVQIAAEHLRSKLQMEDRKTVGVVLGTGLGKWAEGLEKARCVPYDEIPGFPRSTVPGHTGLLWAGRVHDTQALVLQGRFHLYEGYSPEQVCFGVRTLRCLNIDGLVLTNAAGALNPLHQAGELMLVTDHINFTGQNPLIGANPDDWGPRFPDMSRVYSLRLQRLASEQALRLGMTLEKGVYLGLTGPCLETPAETRAFRIWGADAVGMSTVLEAIAARHLGLECLGISCLTNKNLPDCMEETSLDDVLTQAKESSHKLENLLTAVLANWPENHGLTPPAGCSGPGASAGRG
ncbi:MAG: purine-nucleoside phosphorylase [Desulfovibrionales bacterium]